MEQFYGRKSDLKTLQTIENRPSYNDNLIIKIKETSFNENLKK